MNERHRILDWFGIERGTTALIGGGGKTTGMYFLAELLRPHGSVVISTSTKIQFPPHLPFYETLTNPLPFGECITVATLGEKLSAPKQSFLELERFSDYVLVEADGAKRLPLKAHASHEPVIPDCANVVLAVIGLDGIGRPISEAAHRPLLYAEQLHVTEDTLVTPSLAMQAVHGYPRVTGILLNKADDAETLALGRELAAQTQLPCVIGSLRQHIIKEYWRDGICYYS